MNHRVLELLKAPKNIQSEDLTLLKEEINSFPYVQNIRALYLYGVHLYDKGNYQHVLSTTAAYTTDKKILYQLINGKIQQRPKPEIKQEAAKEKTVPAENPLKVLYQAKATGFPIKREDTPDAVPGTMEEPEKESAEKQPYEDVLPTPREEIRHLYVNGERNRILFEGEENFLEDDTVETIDLESTLESGSIVTQKIEKKDNLPAAEEDKNTAENTSPGNGEPESTEEVEQIVPETADEEEKINAVAEEQTVSHETVTDFRDEEESKEDIQNNSDEEGKVDHPATVATESENSEQNRPEEGQQEVIQETDTEEENISDESETNVHQEEAAQDNTQNTNNEEEKTEHSSTVATESENPEHDQAEEMTEFTPETVIGAETIGNEPEKEEILNESEVSFHETEAFMPEVQVVADESEEINDAETVGHHPEHSEFNKTQEVAEFTSEKIINEDEISSEKTENAVQDQSELSFHGTESFLPEVKIQANDQEIINTIPQQNLSKHEDEMRRLIEEVEKKMKQKAASENDRKEEEPADSGHDISFAETQQFEVKPAEPEASEIKTKEVENTGEINADAKKTAGEISEQEIETHQEEPAETRSWKPMSLDTNIPDSLLNKPVEHQSVLETLKEEAVEELQVIEEAKNEKPEEGKDVLTEAVEHPDTDEAVPESYQEAAEQPAEQDKVTATEDAKEEAPVMNVSFFGAGWTIPKSEKNKHQEESGQKSTEEKAAEIPVAKTSQTPKINSFDSNVPGFINTWQSWLKIDRPEADKGKTELKNKVIETFIENNPRISQLKDESSFVVREKGDDISHLMTETLANLYFEQKLYTKAIKAFEILIKKTPEKKKYYEGKIQEIKDFRTKG